MVGDIDAFDYVLCEALGGITLEEMQSRMSNPEFIHWRAFHTYRAAMQKLEREKR